MSEFVLSTFIFFAGFFWPHPGYSDFIVEPDSVIKITGTVVDSQTHSPIPGTIKYERKPHQKNVGIAYSDAQTGEYFLYMIDGREYHINVSAKGYAPKTVSVSINDFNADGEIIKDFSLIPIEENKVLRLNKLFFEQSKSQILEESYPELNNLVQLMRDYPDMIIQLEGHTDYRGNAKLNMQLSKDRVEAVKAYLVGKGIKKRRVKSEAFGGNNPISTGRSEDEHKINRRVEVRILKL